MDRDNPLAGAFYRHLGWEETCLVGLRKRLPPGA
jgi:hypothetical protein